MMSSHSNLLSSVRKVTQENKGRKTPGLLEGYSNLAKKGQVNSACGYHQPPKSNASRMEQLLQEGE